MFELLWKNEQNELEWKFNFLKGEKTLPENFKMDIWEWQNIVPKIVNARTMVIKLKGAGIIIYTTVPGIRNSFKKKNNFSKIN